MKKKLFAALFVLLAVVLLTGCGKKEEEQKPEEPVVGGWELNKEVKATTLMMEEDDVFKKATANYTDYTLEPIGYLGSQVVAGTNHMFLCKATKDGEVTFKVIVVYEDLSGKAEIKEVRDFKVEDFAGTDMGGNNEEVTGGWAASSQCGESSLTEEEREMFKSATEKLLGVDYKPVAVLATQLVSGKNYAILSVGATVTENPVFNIYVVTVYKDLSGNSEVKSVAELDLSYFNE